MVNTIEVKVYMTRKGDMSVKELAHKVGVSPATLGRWFERNDMPTSAAERIIEILEIPEEAQPKIFFAPNVA